VDPVYFPSFSFSTITYKACAWPDKLADFYLDLTDERYQGAAGIFHQRFSTNTLPTWSGTQPFRYALPQRRSTPSRERQPDAGPGGPPRKIKPARGGNSSAGIDTAGSDSAMLDKRLECSPGRPDVRTRRDADPAAWETLTDIGDDVWELLRYPRLCLMEARDGTGRRDLH